MTIDELKEDVAYHCKSVHPRDNTAQTRIAKVLPLLIALWDSVDLLCNPPADSPALDLAQLAVVKDNLDWLNSKLETITFN